MVSHDGIHVPGLSETIKDDINISKFVMGPLFKVNYNLRDNKDDKQKQ
jgi:hypothetical protein